MKIVSGRGFTLIELVVVLAVSSILAAGVVFAMTSPQARLRGEVFSFRSDMVLARSEAVTRNKEVLVVFLHDCEVSTGSSSAVAIDEDTCGAGEQDGYRICVDAGNNKSCGDADDVRIKDVLFAQEVQYYGIFDPGSFPAGGPTKTQAGTSLDTVHNRDGIVFSTATNYLCLKGDGTANASGSLFLYVPGSGLTMAAEPVTVVMNNQGRIRLFRWHTDAAAWQNK